MSETETHNWADAAGGERTANSAVSEGTEVSEHSPALRVKIADALDDRSRYWISDVKKAARENKHRAS